MRMSACGVPPKLCATRSRSRPCSRVKTRRFPSARTLPITAERQSWTFAAQIDQAAVEPIDRRCIAALSENVVLRKLEGQPRLDRRETGVGRAVPLHGGTAP